MWLSVGWEDESRSAKCKSCPVVSAFNVQCSKEQYRYTIVERGALDRAYS